MRRAPALSTHFAALLFGSIGLLTVLYAVEARFIGAGLSKGLLVGVVQCAAELLGALALVRCWRPLSRVDRRALLFLIIGLLAFALADFFWVYLFYYLNMDRKTLPAILLTHIPYGIGYLGMASALLLRLRSSVPFSTLRWTLLGLLLFTVPFYLRFILLPAIGSVAADHHFPFFAAHLFNTFGCFVLVNVSILTIAYLRDIRWSMVAIGAACLVMENWAFRAEMLLIGPPAYGFYDYFWAFGILTSVYPLAYGRGHATIFQVEEVYDGKSLQSRTRFWIVGSSLVFLSLLAMFASPNSVIVRFLAVGTVLTLLLSVFVGQFLVEQIEELSTRLSFKLTDDLGIAESSEATVELPSELKQIYETVFRAKIEEKQALSRVQEELSQHAARVAHDIRSPLAALGLVMHDISAFSEEKRNLVRASVSRINDIANQLLQLSREKCARKEAIGVREELLWPILDELSTEKRLEHGTRSSVRLETEIASNVRDAFTRIDRVALRAALSNVFNNAIQAAPRDSRVLVSMHESATANQIEIEVRDNGPGFPEEVLTNLGQDWNTVGKTGGTGLGLSSSIRTLRAVGGELSVTNCKDGGAAVTIRLPWAITPDWFCSQIDLAPGTFVVVLDDDEPIHQVWASRLQGLVASEHIFHFTTAEGLAKAWPSLPWHAPILFLVDHELLNSQKNGLEIIEFLHIQASSILVTSRYEDPVVRDLAHRLGVPILPKSNVGHVGIRRYAAAKRAAVKETDAELR